MPTHTLHMKVFARWARLVLLPLALVAAFAAEAQPAANQAAPRVGATQAEVLQREAQQQEAPQQELQQQEAQQQEASQQEAQQQEAQQQELQRELLNSERIEQRFGSYGIDVLQSDDRYRVSNLFSVHDGARICRTFAVVLYPERIDARFSAEHEDIVAGGSIGAVFAGNGWTVTKRHLHYGEAHATAKVASLMRAQEAVPLAVHVYVLNVSKGAESFDYATIAEVHHPDYLSVEDLPRIYGPPTAHADPLLGNVLAETEARMR